MKPASRIVLAAAIVVAGCAQSPLYDAARVPGGTRDEVPRDVNGEPMMSQIRPRPTLALLPAPPVMTLLPAPSATALRPPTTPLPPVPPAR